jgi:hypothetical protein
VQVKVISALLAVVLVAGACGSSQPAAEVSVTTTTPSSSRDAAVGEHAVLVHITSLPADAGLDEIEDPLIEAIEQAGVGEFDGNEVGPDDAVLYMYGPDGDALWATVEPVLRAAPLGEGSYAIVRYGEQGAQEKRIEIG